jgi:cell division septum initiation protein DivIVA
MVRKRIEALEKQNLELQAITSNLAKQISELTNRLSELEKKEVPTPKPQKTAQQLKEEKENKAIINDWLYGKESKK